MGSIVIESKDFPDICIAFIADALLNEDFAKDNLHFDEFRKKISMIKGPCVGYVLRMPGKSRFKYKIVRNILDNKADGLIKINKNEEK